MACAGGYYTEELVSRKGYRMLVLNTNLYYDQNKLTANMEDPADQLSWADEVLSQAAANKEKVNCNILDVHLCFSILTITFS